MQEILRQNFVKTISRLILAVFVFAFIHSELGECSSQQGNHASHDFCQLVDGTTHQISRILPIISFKPVIDKDVCLDCCRLAEPALANSTQFVSENPGKLFQSIAIYLQKNSFLI